MSKLSNAAAALLVGAALVAAGGEPDGSKPEEPKLALPDVTGLAGRDAAAPESADGEGKKVVRIAVEVDKNGKIKSGGEGAAKPWRGTNLPKDEGPAGGPAIGVGGIPEAAEPKEFIVKLAVADGKPKIEAGGRVVVDFKALAKAVSESKPKPDVATIDSAADVPFGAVAKAIAVVVEAGLPVNFRAPEELEGKGADKALRKRMAEAAARYPDERGLSELGALVRADERAPWGSVQEVLIATMMAKMWRLAFAATADGKEVVIGNVEGKGPKHPRPAIRYEKMGPDS